MSLVPGAPSAPHVPRADCAPVDERPSGVLTQAPAYLDPMTPIGRVGLAFKRSMVAVRRLRGRETHLPTQLSLAQYELLFGLAHRSGCSARELGEHAELSPASVAQMLERLEAAGLVVRTRSGQDRRVVLSALTDRGAAVLDERRAEQEARFQAALGAFGDDELDVAARVLDRLADYLDDLGQPPAP